MCKGIYAWGKVLLSVIMFSIDDLPASTWKLSFLPKNMIPSIVLNEAFPLTVNIVVITGEVGKELHQSHAVNILYMWCIDMSYRDINDQTMTH